MNILNFFFRLLLTFNATSLILVVYAVKERFILSCLFPKSESMGSDSIDYIIIHPFLVKLLSKIKTNRV